MASQFEYLYRLVKKNIETNVKVALKSVEKPLKSDFRVLKKRLDTLAKEDLKAVKQGWGINPNEPGIIIPLSYFAKLFIYF